MAEIPIVFVFRMDERAVVHEGERLPGMTIAAFGPVELWQGQSIRVRTGLSIAVEDGWVPVYFPAPGLPGVVITGSEVINRETILHVASLGPTLLKLSHGDPIAIMRLWREQEISVIRKSTEG